MSWFNVPYSKKVVEREEKAFKRKYGKVVRLNETKELDMLTVVDEADIEDILNVDENIDEKFDYSDLED